MTRSWNPVYTVEDIPVSVWCYKNIVCVQMGQPAVAALSHVRALKRFIVPMTIQFYEAWFPVMSRLGFVDLRFGFEK